MGSENVFLVWRRTQFDAIERLKDEAFEIFPLNQSTAEEACSRGWRIRAFPWQFIDAATLSSTYFMADERLENWHANAREIRARLGIKPQLETYDDIRIWTVFREFEYCKILIHSLASQCGSGAVWWVPDSEGGIFSDWHGDLDILPMVLRQMSPASIPTIRWMQARAPDTRSSKTPSATPFTTRSALSGPWNWVHLTGLSDPHLHLERALATSSNVIATIDAGLVDASASMFQAFERAHKNLHVIRSVEVPAAIKSQVRQLHALPEPSDPVERAAMLELWPDHLARRSFLEALVRQSGPPQEVWMSDHSSPVAHMLLELVGNKVMRGHMFAHASQLLRGPFQLWPPDNRCWTLLLPTREEAHQAREIMGTRAFNIRVCAFPRFRIGPKRWLRILLRLIRPAPKMVRIGIVPTSGESILAPTMPVDGILDSVRSICEVPDDMANYVNFVVRLRDSEDALGVFEMAVRGVRSPVELIRGRLDSRAKFYRSCALVIEVGHPSSAALESIAEGTPYIRVGDWPMHVRTPDWLKRAVPVFPVPDLWSSLRPICDNIGIRRKLVIRQLHASTAQQREHQIQ